MSVSRDRIVRGVGVAGTVTAVLLGLSWIAVAATVGDCSAFGGRCPAEPPPLLEDDVFGISAGGAFLIAAPLLAWRRGPRRWAIALGGGFATAVLIGLLVRSGAHG